MPCEDGPRKTKQEGQRGTREQQRQARQPYYHKSLVSQKLSQVPSFAQSALVKSTCLCDCCADIGSRSCKVRHAFCSTSSPKFYCQHGGSIAACSSAVLLSVSSSSHDVGASHTVVVSSCLDSTLCYNSGQKIHISITKGYFH